MDKTIIAIHDRHPEFIEYQLFSIEKFVKGEARYVVFNNASDPNIRKEINDLCRDLHIECIQLNGDYSKDISNRHMNAMKTIWGSYVKDMSGLLLWMDGDMFIVNSLDIESVAFHCEIAYSPIYRNNNKIECMWTGVLFFNLDVVDRSVDFSITTIDGFRTDTAGATYHYLKAHPEYRMGYLDTLSIYEWDGSLLRTQLNGCTGYVDFIDGKPSRNYCEGRFFPYEDQDPEYLNSYMAQYDEHKRIIAENGFPKPYDFDLMKFHGDDKSTFYHFKSSSWHDRYGDGKNSHTYLKKEATKKFLGLE